MTKDYARRTRSQSGRKKKSTARKPAARNKQPQNAFNAPSFSGGVIFGAALVLLAGYVPGVFDESVTAVRTQLEPPPQEIVFEFPEMLEQDTITTDPDAYDADFPITDPNAASPEYLVQAASLRADNAAENLRFRLETQGLPASSEKVVLSSGTWYRVTVGPFATRVEADRALTRLREQNLTARLIKLG